MSPTACRVSHAEKTHTQLVTDIPFEPKICRGDCGFVRQIRDAQGKMHFYHLECAKQEVSAHCKGLGIQSTTHSRDTLYRVPERLVRDILEATEENDDVL